MYLPKLFSTDSAKAIKADAYGYLNAIHYMSPHTSGGKGNLCAGASPECIAICIGRFSGQAAMVADLENGMNSVRASRKRKAELFFEDPKAYCVRMADGIGKLLVTAIRMEKILCVRPNGSQDVPWERIRFDYGLRLNVTIFELFPTVQFVDYTKLPERMISPPKNLHLTFSFSGHNWTTCEKLLRLGRNVAVIFGEGLPKAYEGHTVINGDLHDLRHLDPRTGVIVGLSPKGRKAKAMKSAFIIRDYAIAREAA
jgi:hypothetical protein